MSFLASQFVDYEPGIHYSQCQMQAGTTGINAIRIYNPIKQSMDQDSDGLFIKQWIPELKSCPDSFILTPWLWESQDNTYIPPIVEESQARKEASSKLYACRRGREFKSESEKIVQKHASRKKLLEKKTPRITSIIFIFVSEKTGSLTSMSYKLFRLRYYFDVVGYMKIMPSGSPHFSTDFMDGEVIQLFTPLKKLILVYLTKTNDIYLLGMFFTIANMRQIIAFMSDLNDGRIYLLDLITKMNTKFQKILMTGLENVVSKHGKALRHNCESVHFML